jgi:hypothetical protein
MHILEWPRIGIWKGKKVYENLWSFVLKYLEFNLVQNLDHCSHCLIVASLKCWYYSGSHILHVWSSKYIPNQIPCKSYRWVSGGAESLNFSPDNPGVQRIWVRSRYSRPLGYIYPFNRSNFLISFLLHWPVISHLPSPSPLPPLSLKAIFVSHRPNQVRVRVWRLQGVENKDLQHLWRYEALFLLPPKVSHEDLT